LLQLCKKAARGVYKVAETVYIINIPNKLSNMTNLKAAKLQARQMAEVVGNMINATTVKGGFMGLQNQPLDWNGKMTVLTTLLWDTCAAFQSDFKWFADEAASYEQTEQSEASAQAVQSGIEMVQYVIQDVVDEFYANTNELSISVAILDQITDDTETLAERFAVRSELAVLVAKTCQEFLIASDFSDEADKMDEFISFIRQTAQVGMVLAERDVEENAEETSAPSAINALDALFQAA
jgi:hypothetical protein